MMFRPLSARTSWMIFIGCVASMLASAAGAAHAPQHMATEAAVKAAYIYRFLEYIAWPAQAFQSPDQALVIGTTENDDVTAELNRLVSDRSAQNRRLRVVSVTRVRGDEPIHVLYVADTEAARSVSALEAARKRPILIITDEAEGLEKGATINFVENEGRIRFEVSLAAANRAGLTISARLLAVATRIKKGEYRLPRYAGLDRGRSVQKRLNAQSHAWALSPLSTRFRAAL